MPRRNRNAGTPRLDADQLAADLDQLAADLCPDHLTGHGKSTVVLRYLARTIMPGTVLTVIDAKKPLAQLTAESR